MGEPSPPTAAKPLIQVEDVVKEYVLGDVVVHALGGVSLSIEAGEMVAVMGPSGSGKSTFMNLIGCLDRPTAGRLWLDGVELGALSRDERAEIRNRKIGFVFQGFNLLARTPALENVELPLVYGGVPRRERLQRAREALAIVGLGQRMHHLPTQLSGGQQQRVAIARALVGGAPLLLADEPTGNLDSRTSDEVMSLLVRLNEERGVTVVLVTHEPDVASYAARTIVFRDGHVSSDHANRDRRRPVATVSETSAEARP